MTGQKYKVVKFETSFTRGQFFTCSEQSMRLYNSHNYLTSEEPKNKKILLLKFDKAKTERINSKIAIFMHVT